VRLLVNDVQCYHVEWLVCYDQLQLDVTVTVCDGLVLSIEPGRTANAIDLGQVAMVEGLVNAHTHLEFTSLNQPIPTTGRFTDWIRSVVKYRRENPGLISAAIGKGIEESSRSGTTVLGEIATVGWSPADYEKTGFKGTVFQELIGLSPDRIQQQAALAGSHLSRNNIGAKGISPHAPYSTHLDLVHESVEFAFRTNCPLAMHLAETKAELELLDAGVGEFREMLIDFGVWREGVFQTPRKPIHYLEKLATAPRSLVIHGNYLDDAELKFIASHPQMTLVYCPRTHAAFGHSEHPWRRLIELGGRVAIGTDSRASNPDLSLFTELQFLAARYPDLSHLDLLRIGSSNGRIALGFEPHSTGKSPADFTLIGLAGSSQRTPPPELFGPSNRVCGTMVNGEWVWIAPDLKNRMLNP
jgi:aminodeoxyfutalosine deaminase